MMRHLQLLKHICGSSPSELSEATLNADGVVPGFDKLRVEVEEPPTRVSVGEVSSA